LSSGGKEGIHRHQLRRRGIGGSSSRGQSSDRWQIQRQEASGMLPIMLRSAISPTRTAAVELRAVSTGLEKEIYFGSRGEEVVLRFFAGWCHSHHDHHDA
jgi:hypothetical protein